MVSKRGVVGFLGILAIVAASFAFLWMVYPSERTGVQMSPAAPVPFYRLYNGATGDHAWETNINTRNQMISTKGYSDEGIEFYVPYDSVSYTYPPSPPSYGEAASGVHYHSGVIRLYEYVSPAGDYAYTIIKGEFGGLISSYREIAAIFSTQQAGTVPLYRVRNSVDVAITSDSSGAAASGYDKEPNGPVLLGYVYPSLAAWQATQSSGTGTTDTGTTTTTPEPGEMRGSFDGIGVYSGCDTANALQYVSGWVCNPIRPNAAWGVRVEMTSPSGEKSSVSGTASLPREDIKSSCGNSGAHAYVVDLPRGLNKGTTIKIIGVGGLGEKEVPLSGGASNVVACGMDVTMPPKTVTPTTVADTTANYVGAFDGVSCASISGWVCDTKHPNSIVKISVHSPIGVEVASGLANANSGEKDDIAAIKTACTSASGAHRFTIAIPEAWKTDNQQHDVVVYPIGKVNSDGTPVPITGGNGEVVIQSVKCTGEPATSTTSGGAGECRNNIKDAGEVCDGNKLGGASCTTIAKPLVNEPGFGDIQLQFNMGTLKCAADCKSFDYSDCRIKIPAKKNGFYGQYTSFCANACIDGKYCYGEGFIFNGKTCKSGSWVGQKGVGGLLKNGVRCVESSNCESGNCFRSWYQLKILAIKGTCRPVGYFPGQASIDNYAKSTSDQQ